MTLKKDTKINTISDLTARFTDATPLPRLSLVHDNEVRSRPTAIDRGYRHLL
jgi:hypothetical protein